MNEGGQYIDEEMNQKIKIKSSDIGEHYVGGSYR